MATTTPRLGLTRPDATDSPTRAAYNATLDALEAQAATRAEAYGAQANLLVNGGFDVWQRGAGPFSANSAYSTDRWQISLGTTSTLAVSQEPTEKATGSKYSAKLVYVHNSQSRLVQKIEHTSQLQGRTVSLTAQVKTATANAVRLAISADNGANWSYSDYHSGSGSWETLTLEAYAIDAAASAILIAVALEASTTAYADNAMLAFGAVAPDFVPEDPAAELTRCQRYYELIGGVASAVALRGYASAASEVLQWPLRFAVVKGGTPTITKNGTWATVNCAAGSPTIIGASPGGCSLQLTASAAGSTAAVIDSGDDTITVEWNP